MGFAGALVGGRVSGVSGCATRGAEGGRWGSVKAGRVGVGVGSFRVHCSQLERSCKYNTKAVGDFLEIWLIWRSRLGTALPLRGRAALREMPSDSASASWVTCSEYVVSNGGRTIAKKPVDDDNPLWYQQGALFDAVIRDGDGMKSFTFTIDRARYDDAHLFLGVADATGDNMAWAFSPSTGSLYFHADMHKW